MNNTEKTNKENDALTRIERVFNLLNKKEGVTRPDVFSAYGAQNDNFFGVLIETEILIRVAHGYYKVNKSVFKETSPVGFLSIVRNKYRILSRISYKKYYKKKGRVKHNVRTVKDSFAAPVQSQNDGQIHLLMEENRRLKRALQAFC